MMSFQRGLGSLLALLPLYICSVSAVEIRHGGGQNSSGYPPLPLLFAEGTHYQVGYQIGAAFSSEILTTVQSNAFFNDKILPYNSTSEGAGWYKSLLGTATRFYPQYVQELQGMADGANIPFPMMFLWNLKGEWEILLKNRGEDVNVFNFSGSDFFLAIGGSIGTFFGHNADNNPINIQTSYMVHARVTDIDQKTNENLTDEFLAFCYAGSLCGNTFGINFTKRTITTIDPLYPKNINTTGLARNFFLRATLSMDYAEIESHFNFNPEISSGFNINAGNLDGELTINSIEVAPSSGDLGPLFGYRYHFNSYMYTSPNEYYDPSSVHRQDRVGNLFPPENPADMLKILGDTGDKEYPIFRTATPPGTAATVATALFDLSKGVMYVYRGNPGEVEPQLIVPFPQSTSPT